MCAHLKLQELDQEKISFLARTSHELRTPLTALQGYLKLLTHGKAGVVNELQSDLLIRSLDSCRRLLGLANSLMDLSALNGSRTRLQLESGDIQECVSRAALELRQAIEAKGLELKIDNDGGIPKFRFDFDRMHQVVVNLLENALQVYSCRGRDPYPLFALFLGTEDGARDDFCLAGSSWEGPFLCFQQCSDFGGGYRDGHSCRIFARHL